MCKAGGHHLEVHRAGPRRVPRPPQVAKRDRVVARSLGDIRVKVLSEPVRERLALARRRRVPNVMELGRHPAAHAVEIARESGDRIATHRPYETEDDAQDKEEHADEAAGP